MSESLHPHIEMLAEYQPALAFVGLIACGMLCCYFGYRTTHFLVDASGFVFAGLVALLIAGVITQGNLLYMGLALLLGGLVGALLAHRIYRLGVMIIGGGVCALLVWHFAEALPSERWELPAVIIAGLLGAVVALFLHRFIISMATAVLGGLFITHGIFLLLAFLDIKPSAPDLAGPFSGAAPFAMAWAGLAATGFIFQMLLGKTRADNPGK